VFDDVWSEINPYQEGAKMSDEVKKEGQEPANTVELSAEDLEQVTGGADVSISTVQQENNLNKSKAASKSVEAMKGYLAQ
jgi:hypothetical protein